jgi:DNA-binding HxlR family transcriptional regulator
MVAKHLTVSSYRSGKTAAPTRRFGTVEGGASRKAQDDAGDDVPETTGRRRGVVPMDLDRLIHERLRLGLVSALAVNESLSFTEIKELLRTTDGNLSVHARKLEEAKYITVSKSFEGRMPHTEYKLTSAGRKALERYLEHMESIIRVTRER